VGQRPAGIYPRRVLVTITSYHGILVLGVCCCARHGPAEAASAISYQTAAMASEVARSTPAFTALAAGTTCDTLAVAQLPRIRVHRGGRVAQADGVTCGSPRSGIRWSG